MLHRLNNSIGPSQPRNINLCLIREVFWQTTQKTTIFRAFASYTLGRNDHVKKREATPHFTKSTLPIRYKVSSNFLFDYTQSRTDFVPASDLRFPQYAIQGPTGACMAPYFRFRIDYSILVCGGVTHSVRAEYSIRACSIGAMDENESAFMT